MASKEKVAHKVFFSVPDLHYVCCSEQGPIKCEPKGPEGQIKIKGDM